MFEILDVFFFGMNPDVLRFTSDFKFWILVADILTQILPHSFVFLYCVTNFAKNFNLSLMVSLWCELFVNFQFAPWRVKHILLESGWAQAKNFNLTRNWVYNTFVSDIFSRFKNDKIVQSKNNQILEMTNLKMDDSGLYRCRVHNDAGRISSRPAVLNVTGIGFF